MRKKPVTFKMPPVIIESLRKQASKRGLSQAFLLEIAYREWLERNSGEKHVVAPIGIGQRSEWKW